MMQQKHFTDDLKLNRPEPGDRAAPLAYGDLVFFSCQLEISGSYNNAYLCEEGCIIKDSRGDKNGEETEMANVSSRELVFQICTAAAVRALLELKEYKRRLGFVGEMEPPRQLQPTEEAELHRLTKQKEREEHANKSQARHMAGRPVRFGETIRLRQIKSQAYLGVDIGQAPRSDPTSKMVVLHHVPGKAVGFRIMPRFGYLVEGHTVCFGDSVSLESKDFPEEYLTASEKCTIPSALGTEVKMFEVNLKPQSETAWKLDCFFPYSMESEKHVKGGDVVRLYHPFHDAYVAANATDATLSLQRADGSLSSTMWIIRDENVLSGGLIRLTHSYTFMHLVSRRHMTATTQQLEPALRLMNAEMHGGGGGGGGGRGDASTLYSTRRDLDDPDSLFFAVETKEKGGPDSIMMLEPLEDDKESVHLNWGGRVRMVLQKNGAGRSYLHCINSHQLKSPLRDAISEEATDAGRSESEFESMIMDAEHEQTTDTPEYVIVASPALFREDSFDVEKVPEEEVHAVDTLAQILPKLKQHLDELRKIESHGLEHFGDESPMMEAIMRLLDLESFVYTGSNYEAMQYLDEGEALPKGFCQNFMRDRGAAELLMGILNCSCDIFRQQWLTQSMLELESLLMRDGNPKIEKGNVQRRMKFQELLDYCLENDKQKVQRVTEAQWTKGVKEVLGAEFAWLSLPPDEDRTVDYWSFLHRVEDEEDEDWNQAPGNYRQDVLKTLQNKYLDLAAMIQRRAGESGDKWDLPPGPSDKKYKRKPTFLNNWDHHRLYKNVDLANLVGPLGGDTGKPSKHSLAVGSNLRVDGAGTVMKKRVLGLNENRTARLVCELCYRVLRHMVHKHAKNSVYLARFMEQIQQQLSLDLGAERVLLGILDDNEPLLQRMAMATSNSGQKMKHVFFHLEALTQRGKDAMHLRFLSAMAAVGEHGIERHQDQILSHITNKNNKNRVLLQIRMANGAVELKDTNWRESGFPAGWQVLGAVVGGATRAGDRAAPLRRMLEYWVESLLLLARLCQPARTGRRDFLVRKVRRLIQFDVCRCCLQDDGLPDRLRHNMCEFIRLAYVEDDDFRKKTRLTGVEVWKDLDTAGRDKDSMVLENGSIEDDDATGAPGDGSQKEEARAEDIEEVKNTVRNYLSQNTCQYYPGETQYSNLLKLAMMQLWRQLVLFGHYHEEELGDVVKETRKILDFNSMRFRDAMQQPETRLLDESFNNKGGANNTGLDSSGVTGDEGTLSEHTISIALRHLRPLCNDIPPVLIARIVPMFKFRVFEAGQLMVELGDPAADMYVIQSGKAFVIEVHEGVEAVVDTLSPGRVFGEDTLIVDKRSWQWRVKCSQKVTALHLRAEAFRDACENIQRAGALPMTDSLEVILETKRVACDLINDVYDLRLAHRTQKMLQEYRFDTTISEKKYVSAETSNNVLKRFPKKRDGQDLEVPTDFVVNSTPILGPFSESVVPMERVFFGLLRIDHGVVGLALLQILVAIVILIFMASSLSNDDPAPHPGPYKPAFAIAINIAATCLWAVGNVGHAWCAWTGGMPDRSSVQNACFWCAVGQLIYAVFFVINTLAGVAMVASDLASGDGRQQDAVTQVLWLVLGTPAVGYAVLASASLYVHVESGALFALDEGKEEEGKTDKPAPPPRMEFINTLQHMDLDKGGELSRTLADLIISSHRPLVIDAFHLLVRTHHSQHDLHASLVKTLVLMEVDARKFNKHTDRLMNDMLKVANAMQEYIVQQTYLGGGATSQVEGGAVLADDAIKSKIENGYHSAEDEKGGDAEEDESEFNSGVSTAIHDECVDNVDILLDKLLETIGGGKALPRADSSGGSGSNEHHHLKQQRRLLQRKGMHKILARLLRSLRADYLETTGPRCYSALSLLCDGDPGIQGELKELEDTMVAHFDSVPKSVCELLTEMHKDNIDLCYKVEESMIERIITLVSEDPQSPCYLVFLRTIITPREQIVRRNQNLVAKYLDKEDIVLGAKVRDEPWLRAHKELKGSRKKYYIACIELLTACMAQYNYENKSRCRGGNSKLTFTLKDIEMELRDRTLSPRVKIALLHFLQEAYIIVDFTNTHFLMQPEMSSIFDHYGRTLELLHVGSDGSKISGLKRAERDLLTVAYVQVGLSLVKAIAPSELRSPESTWVRIGGRMLEAVVSVMLSCRKGSEEDGGRDEGAGAQYESCLRKEEELKMLELVQRLCQAVKHSHLRFTKENPRNHTEKQLKDLLGEMSKDERSERAEVVRQQILEQEKKALQENLDVPNGVRAFADDFLNLMDASGKQEFEQLVESFREQGPELRHGGANESELRFSDQHLKSLVELLSSPASLTDSLRQTGLAILRRVVETVPFPDEEPVQGGGSAGARGEWLRAGVPKMIIALVSSASSSDTIVLESLSIGIILLERGKRRAQDAFYSLFRSNNKANLFQNIRDRLVRAERGLATFQATFQKKARELEELIKEDKDHALTIAGVQEIAQEDRWCRSFVGSHPEEVLRFLQLLCEGHNKKMQEYLQHQGKTSIDLVTCAADFLAAASRHIHPASIRLVIQCVDTLVEVVQNPCRTNQLVLMDTQLPHVLNQFLQMPADFPVQFDDIKIYERNVEELKTGSVTLLLSLLERVDDTFVPSRILKALEIDKLILNMNMLRTKYLKQKPAKGEGGQDAEEMEVEDNGKQEEEDEEAEEIAEESLSEDGAFTVACSLFMLFTMLQYYDEDDQHGLAAKANRKHIKDFARLRANCGFIEISRDGKLERVFFQIPSVCRYLSKASKRNIVRKVNRDNHQDQMLDFLKRGQVRYEEMVHLQELNRSWFYTLLMHVGKQLDQFFFLTALTINVLMLLGFRYKDDQYVTLEDMSNIVLPAPWYEGVLILSSLQLIISAIRLVAYYIETGVLRVKRLFTRREAYYHILTELYGGPQYYWVFTKLLLTDGYFLLLCVYFLSNLVAVVMQSQTTLVFFLMSFHLVDMFNLSPALRNVTVAVSSRANTLLQTAGLAFVMMYIYSAIGFVLFAESFSFEASEIQDGNEMDYNVNAARCDTIWKCFLVTVDMGLRKGDIGGGLEDIQWRDIIPGTFVEECDSPPGLEYMGCLGIGGNDVGPYIFLRIMYTTTFFVFINTILINIIFGVIIDTFGDLRRQNQDMEEEMEQKCFICGLERYRFEINSADGNGFDNHIQNDHNMWVYIYFIIYLYTKEVDRQSGFESFVFDKIHEVDENGVIHHKRTPDVSWFPAMEAMVLKTKEDSQMEEDLLKRIKLLKDEASNLASYAGGQIEVILKAVEERQEREERDQDLDETQTETSSGSSMLDRSSLPPSNASRQPGSARSASPLARMANGGVRGLLSGVMDQVAGSMLGRRWARELQQLAEQGYDNAEHNLELLTRFEGDLSRVVQELERESEGTGMPPQW